jgi:predicted alpha/beta-hydrolase family hydrolase
VGSRWANARVPLSRINAAEKDAIRMQLKVYRSKSPLAALVVAHGAGGGQNTSFMVRTAEGLAARGIVVATFDFPYMSAGRSAPDKAPVLEQAWREAIDRARVEMAGLPLFIGGKSMGGRIASHVASQGCPDLAGLVFLGYPLHPPGKPAQRRDAHLPAIAEPMLFVQGSRDAFGTSEEIRALLSSLQHATLHELSGGDHSFKVSGRGAPTPDVVHGQILDAVTDWIRERCR